MYTNGKYASQVWMAIKYRKFYEEKEILRHINIHFFVILVLKKKKRPDRVDAH